MKLSELSIRRPVFATVLSLAIILLGILSLTRLPVREYPDIDPPVVSIVTFYRGASSNVVETEITDVLEEQLATIEGIKTITSSSRDEGSTITVEFELSRDVEEAANDVRDRVSRVRASLPEAADDPIVSKVDTNAQPIYWIALSSDTVDPLRLSEIAEVDLKDPLQRLPGVANVFIGAQRRYAMRVWLDPDRMAARGVTPSEVEDAIRRGNAEVPGGRVEGNEREFSVRTRGELDKPDQFSAIVVKEEGDDRVRLGDVARVVVGPEDERTIARWNGKLAIGLGVVKQNKASTLEVAKVIRNALPELRKRLPAGVVLETAYDSSLFIQDSLNEVVQTIFIAAALVFLVVFLFLKSFRATLIPAVAIPVSIVGTFTIVYFLGFTVNILTLLALVLAIGLVVDDAIVMLENVYRHIEMGKPRMQAALDGAHEIGFAIVATTIALVAVFVPVAFLTGNVGRLFTEFAISLAVAVAISMLVALSFSPMLCSRILAPLHSHTRENWASRSFEAFFRGLDRVYRRHLGWSLDRPWLLVSGAVVIVAAAYFVFKFIPSELVPTEDRSTAFGIVIAPEGSTLEYTDHYMRQLEDVLLSTPEHQGLFSATGLGFGGPGQVTNGFVFYLMKPRNERSRTQQEVVASLFPRTFSIPGVLAFLINPPSLGGQFSTSPVEYVLQADTYEQLGQAVGTFMGKASKLGYLINLDSDLRLNKPQLDIDIDRDRASSLGVSVTEIGGALETLLGGRVVTNFKRGSKQYDVIVQLEPKDRARPDVVNEVYVRGAGGLVQLANVVQVKETVAPKELNHYNRIRAATISANLAPGVALGQALDDLDHIVASDLPGVRHDLSGQSREFRESSHKLYLLFLFSIVFIYLVLAAQFESFVHPLTILLSVPLAVTGALVSLFVFHQTLNIYSQIGLIMLIGLVTKNAILIVEFSNQLRARGLGTREAVAEAAGIRLRPILMTTLATIFGVLPIALGIGAGGEARMPLGIAVVGGLAFSTSLTLFLVPVVYLLLSRLTPAREADTAPTPAAAAPAPRLAEPTR
ncbi:MAG: efflux RND transporter permease subunit [bacterium]